MQTLTHKEDILKNISAALSLLFMIHDHKGNCIIVSAVSWKKIYLVTQARPDQPVHVLIFGQIV